MVEAGEWKIKWLAEWTSFESALASVMSPHSNDIVGRMEAASGLASYGHWPRSRDLHLYVLILSQSPTL